MKKYIVILLLTIKAMNDINAQNDTVTTESVRHRWEFGMDYRNRSIFNLGNSNLVSHGIGLNFGYAPISNKHFYIYFNMCGNYYNHDFRRNILFTDNSGNSFYGDRSIYGSLIEFKLNSYYGFPLNDIDNFFYFVLGPTVSTGLEVFSTDYLIVIPNFYNYGGQGRADRTLFKKSLEPSFGWHTAAGAKLRCYPFWGRFFIDIDAGIGFGTRVKSLNYGLEGIDDQTPIVMKTSTHPNAFTETIGYLTEGSPIVLHFKIGLGFNFFYFKPKDVVKI
jgi:hypothetical protein